MAMIQDAYGRTFKTLRVSLLNRCNLACIYCREDENNSHSANGSGSSDHTELIEIIKGIHGHLSLDTIRLTGGEPLLYSNLTALIQQIREIGIFDIRLTTNGYLLERMAGSLRKAGVTSMNISLDALDEEVFFLMSKRNNVGRIINGIEAAIEEGIDVKINSVMMKGVNDSQLIPLLEYAFEKNIIIRFLELMSMGHLFQKANKYLLTELEMLDRIAEKYNFVKLVRRNSATANYWRTDEGQVFGIIANESHPFCHDCNRLRLDSKGNIYGCLSSNDPISVAGIRDPLQLQKKLQQALLQKQAVRFTGSDLSMIAIGG